MRRAEFGGSLVGVGEGAIFKKRGGIEFFFVSLPIEMGRMLHSLYVSSVLILFVLSHCGVMMETCSCTGRTSVALPLPDDCCPSESGCMDISVHQFSGNYLIADTHIAMPQGAVPVANPVMAAPQTFRCPMTQMPPHSSPPGRKPVSCVLRV